MNQLLPMSSSSLPSPLASSPYKLTILFLLCENTKLVLHSKSLLRMFTVFKVNSIPLLFTSPKFVHIDEYPVITGIDRSTNKSRVSIL